MCALGENVDRTNLVLASGKPVLQKGTFRVNQYPGSDVNLTCQQIRIRGVRQEADPEKLPVRADRRPDHDSAAGSDGSGWSGEVPFDDPVGGRSNPEPGRLGREHVQLDEVRPSCQHRRGAEHSSHPGLSLYRRSALWGLLELKSSKFALKLWLRLLKI